MTEKYQSSFFASQWRRIFDSSKIARFLACFFIFLFFVSYSDIIPPYTSLVLWIILHSKFSCGNEKQTRRCHSIRRQAWHYNDYIAIPIFHKSRCQLPLKHSVIPFFRASGYQPRRRIFLGFHLSRHPLHVPKSKPLGRPAGNFSD